MRKRHFSDGTAYYAKTQTQSAEQARRAYTDKLIGHIKLYNRDNKDDGVFYSKDSIGRFLSNYDGKYES